MASKAELAVIRLDFTLLGIAEYMLAASMLIAKFLRPVSCLRLPAEK